MKIQKRVKLKKIFQKIETKKPTGMKKQAKATKETGL